MINTPKFPLKTSDTFVFENVKDAKEVVRFHLKNLLLTFPGEKISDPSYGVGIKQYLFEPLTQPTLNLIEDRIETAIINKLRYLRNFKVKVSESGEYSIRVQIVYSIPGLTSGEMVDINFSSSTQY